MDIMRIEVGMRFSVHWNGHQEYNNKEYEVLSIIRGCNCSHPKVWLHKTCDHTPIHIHIRATRVDVIESGYSYFGFIDENLQDIYDPSDYFLQLKSTSNPVQLSMF